MKTSFVLASALSVVPAIAVGVVLSALTPAWLLPPATVFGLFLLSVVVLVHFFGVVVGLVLRLLVWAFSGGMLLVALYAITLGPERALLAWIVVATALIALVATPPPGRRLAR